MIVAPRFVFLHLHKSGGTFVNECLLGYVPGAVQLGYHLPRARIPATHAALPILGFVRNPWSYYVSWYSFQVARLRPNPLFQVLSDGGRLDFHGTIRNMVTLSSAQRLLDAVVSALPAHYTNHGLNLPAFALRAIERSDLGFYAFLYSYMFGPADHPRRIGRMESLRTDLPMMLEQVGERPSDALLEHVARAAPVNTSRHAGYASYYDAELRDLVAERDAAVIEAYDYRFGD